MEERKDLEEKILTYKVLQARLEALVKQRDMVASKFVELQTTLASIDEIKKSSGDVLFPIGSEAYAFGKIANKKTLIVEIGAGIALKKSPAEGKKILEKRRLDIQAALNTLQGNIMEISSRLEQLEPEIEQLSKKLETPEGG